jgi:hypothetical protein
MPQAPLRVPPEAEDLLLRMSWVRRRIDDAWRALTRRERDLANEVALERGIGLKGQPAPSAAEVNAAGQILSERRRGIYRSEFAHLAAEVVAAEREWLRIMKRLDAIDLGEGLGHLPEAVGVDAAYDGERGLTIRVGGKSFSFTLPIPIDRGVWREARDYERGDTVTHDGSLWIARNDKPSHVPGMGGDWRLAVPKGRNGRDAERKGR